MDKLIFGFYIILFASLLRAFYIFQRKFFRTTYYSFFELVTGIPQNLSFTQVIFIRFLPPFLITFLAYKLVNPYLNYHFMLYSLIGLVAALINVIPALSDIVSYKGVNEDKLELKEKLSSIYVIYLLYILSFFLLSAGGAFVASEMS